MCITTSVSGVEWVGVLYPGAADGLKGFRDRSVIGLGNYLNVYVLP